MKLHIYLRAAVACLAILAASCSLAEELPAEPPRDPVDRLPQPEFDLTGTTWDLYAYRRSSLIEDTNFTLTFSSDQVSGNAGCNLFFGAYQLDQEKIRFSDLGMTEMACMEPEGLMEQEQYLLEFLGSIQRFEKDADKLTLFREDGETLSFNASPDR